jgi:hypothetical protein
MLPAHAMEKASRLEDNPIEELMKGDSPHVQEEGNAMPLAFRDNQVLNFPGITPN